MRLIEWRHSNATNRRIGGTLMRLHEWRHFNATNRTGGKRIGDTLIRRLGGTLMRLIELAVNELAAL
jgi:hypothetical protein